MNKDGRTGDECGGKTKRECVKSLRDLDLRGGEEKKKVSVCSAPCDSWRNSTCDSVLCIVSRQHVMIRVMRCLYW